MSLGLDRHSFNPFGTNVLCCIKRYGTKLARGCGDPGKTVEIRLPIRNVKVYRRLTRVIVHTAVSSGGNHGNRPSPGALSTCQGGTVTGTGGMTAGFGQDCSSALPGVMQTLLSMVLWQCGCGAATAVPTPEVDVTATSATTGALKRAVTFLIVLHPSSPLRPSYLGAQ